MVPRVLPAVIEEMAGLDTPRESFPEPSLRREPAAEPFALVRACVKLRQELALFEFVRDSGTLGDAEGSEDGGPSRVETLDTVRGRRGCTGLLPFGIDASNVL